MRQHNIGLAWDVPDNNTTIDLIEEWIDQRERYVNAVENLEDDDLEYYYEWLTLRYIGVDMKGVYTPREV